MKGINLIFLLFLFLALIPLNAFSQAYNSSSNYVASMNVNMVSMNYFTTTSGTYKNDGISKFLYNWHNDGVVNFTTGISTGTTQFIGSSSVQKISGTGTSKFYSILFDNAFAKVAFDLQSEIHVYGNVDFSDGVIEESLDGLVVFQNDAVYTNVSNESFVDGKVQKVGDDAFVFPIGDDNGAGVYLYRPASISTPANSSDTYEAQYFWKPTTFAHDISLKEPIIEVIDNSEYWEINQISGTVPVSVTLSWLDSEITTSPSEVLSDISKLIIVRWDGTQWINEGGVVDESTNTITTLPSGYGTFTLAQVHICKLTKEFISVTKNN